MPTKKTAAKSTTTRKRATSSNKKAASPKARAASTSSRTNAKKAGDQEVTIDRRRKADRRGVAKEATVLAPKLENSVPKLEKREKVQRRRQIDPTTCERDYSEQEVQFMNAMDEYKRTSGRMFPTCSEVLEVIRNLGYVQLTPAELAVVRPEDGIDKNNAAEDQAEENEETEEATLTASGWEA